jgi:hypothetical protein
MTTVQGDEQDRHDKEDKEDKQAAPLDQVTPLVIIDDEGRIRGVLLAQSALAPDLLYERLCERAESWLASRAGAKLRAQALEEALRVGGLSAADLRLDLVTVLDAMLHRTQPRAELGPDITTARLILEEDAFREILLETMKGCRCCSRSTRTETGESRRRRGRGEEEELGMTMSSDRPEVGSAAGAERVFARAFVWRSRCAVIGRTFSCIRSI